VDPEANIVSVLPGRGDGTFRAKRHYRTGRFPFSVAVGDLNGDGKPDLVTANWANTVSVFTNTGDGSFSPRRDYATGEEPWVVAIGDLNGDSKPDLAAADHAPRGTVTVLTNRGDGAFEPRRVYRTGSEPRSVAIGDLNGDQKPDLATANHDSSTLSVLVNRGDGTFNAKRDYATGYGPSSVAIGDLNGDGRTDIVITSVVIARADTVTVSVLLNRGGTFQARRDYRAGRYPNSPEYDPSAVALGDLNGDGEPDLAIAIRDERLVWVLTSTGGGTFRPKLDYSTGRAPSAAAIGDLNGDGKLDLATNVSVLLNTPGLCTVQPLEGVTLAAAKRTMARASCRVGKIRRPYSRIKRGRVISQKPRFGAVLPGGGKVDLVVSRGRKR
jgi:hypothetical protein